MSNINQRQVQKLLQKLSPQQIQMIKLLELPAVQLEQRVKQEIEENPVLEEEATEENDEQQTKEVSVEEYFAEDDTPRYKYHANNYSKDDQKRPVYLTEGMSFHENLIEQLGFKNLSPREMTLGQYLIGSIDDDGYLRRSLSSIADDIAFSLGIETTEQELESVLKVIHELEPTGVGSRNLQECLLLQMHAMPQHSEAQKLAMKILTNYFDEFTKKHYEKLMSRLSVGEDEFRDAIEEIVRLSPKPGNLYSDGKNDNQPYIIPDFTLDYQNGIFELSLNSSNIPDIKVNRRYVEMIREMATRGGQSTEADREAIQFVKNKIDSAKWFISAIKQRHADAYDAGHTGLSARVLHRRRPVEVAPDDPQGHRRRDESRRIDDLARGEQQVRADAIRNHTAQAAVLGGDADRQRRGSVVVRDQEPPLGVHRQGGQAQAADG